MNMSKTVIKMYFIFLFVIALSFAGHTVLVGSQYVSQGAEVAQLQKQEKDLTFQTQQLQQQLAQQSAASSIAQLADAQGFKPATQIISLQTGFVASR
jgi:cell division protein FtsL